MISKLLHRARQYWHLSLTTSMIVRRTRLEALQVARKKETPKALAGYGYKVFSQSDEDGIINEIFRRIGHTNKTFVEFGVGDGLENNTLALLYDGWSGLWIEGSRNFCAKIKAGFPQHIKQGILTIKNSFILKENIDGLIREGVKGAEIDLLSVDLDSNDAHIIRAIKSVSARVVVAEYNAKFGPSIDYCMAYNESYAWQKTDRFGASLKHLERTLAEKGYSLVGCNVVGTNAFFVRNDLVANKFLEPYTSEQHYESARYELVGLPSGHPSSYDTINNKV